MGYVGQSSGWTLTGTFSYVVISYPEKGCGKGFYLSTDQAAYMGGYYYDSRVYVLFAPKAASGNYNVVITTAYPLTIYYAGE